MYQHAPHVKITSKDIVRDIVHATKENYNMFKSLNGLYSITYELQLGYSSDNTVFDSVKLGSVASIMSVIDDFDHFIDNAGDSNHYDNFKASDLKTHSLKAENMVITVGNPYRHDDYWCIMIYVKVRNLDNITAISYDGSEVFFVPIMFAIEYTQITFDIDMSKTYWTPNPISLPGYKLVSYKDVLIGEK